MYIPLASFYVLSFVCLFGEFFFLGGVVFFFWGGSFVCFVVVVCLLLFVVVAAVAPCYSKRPPRKPIKIVRER